MKLACSVELMLTLPSLPTWERELKPGAGYGLMGKEPSLPTWERELKHDDEQLACISMNIAPYVGA